MIRFTVLCHVLFTGPELPCSADTHNYTINGEDFTIKDIMIPYTTILASCLVQSLCDDGYYLEDKRWSVGECNNHNIDHYGNP